MAANSPYIGVDVSSTSTTPIATVGDQIRQGGLTYEYAKASAALSAGDLCALIEAGTAAKATYAVCGSGAIPTKLGVPQVAFASGDYGWFVRQGDNFKLSVAASCAKDVKLYTTGTEGVVDDASSTQSLIPGLRINTTVTDAAVVSDASAAVPLYCN